MEKAAGVMRIVEEFFKVADSAANSKVRSKDLSAAVMWMQKARVVAVQKDWASAAEELRLKLAGSPPKERAAAKRDTVSDRRARRATPMSLILSSKLKF